MDDVRVLTDAAAVEAALDPIRASILDALTEPGSAASVAAAIGLTRQKVNYHLKALEAHGLVELAEERVWGGITERIVRRSRAISSLLPTRCRARASIRTRSPTASRLPI